MEVVYLNFHPYFNKKKYALHLSKTFLVTKIERNDTAAVCAIILRLQIHCDTADRYESNSLSSLKIGFHGCRENKGREIKTCPLSSSGHSGADVFWSQLLPQSIVHCLVLFSCVRMLTTQTTRFVHLIFFYTANSIWKYQW